MFGGWAGLRDYEWRPNGPSGYTSRTTLQHIQPIRCRPSMITRVAVTLRSSQHLCSRTLFCFQESNSFPPPEMSYERFKPVPAFRAARTLASHRQLQSCLRDWPRLGSSSPSLHHNGSSKRHEHCLLGGPPSLGGGCRRALLGGPWGAPENSIWTP